MELEERTTLPSAGENMASGWGSGGEVEADDPVASHDAATRDRADVVPYRLFPSLVEPHMSREQPGTIPRSAKPS
jgi:hypothetical protein